MFEIKRPIFLQVRGTRQKNLAPDQYQAGSFPTYKLALLELFSSSCIQFVSFNTELSLRHSSFLKFITFQLETDF